MLIGYRKRHKPTILPHSLVGKGVQLSPMHHLGKTVVNTGLDRVIQSLYCILSTPRGARLFNPEFGTKLYDCLDEPNDFILKDSLEYNIKQDIKTWEKRIDFDVHVKQPIGSNKVIIEIAFNIKGTEQKYTYVFPVSKTVHKLGENVEE